MVTRLEHTHERFHTRLLPTRLSCMPTRSSEESLTERKLNYNLIKGA